MYRLLFIILIALTIPVSAKGILEITQADIPGGRIIRKDYYDGKSLWGYIDGGADIYLEYGFDKVVVEDIQWQGQIIKLEVYKMKSPEAAFGIFSISKSKCSGGDSLSEYSCISPYQVQICTNDLYISIVNDNGSADAKKLCILIGRTLLSKINPGIFALPEVFNEEVFSPYIKDLKFFSGTLGLQNSLPEMTGMFEQINSYSVYYLPLELTEGYFNLFLINFTKQNDLFEFCSRAALDCQINSRQSHTEKAGLYRNLIKLSSERIVYVETNLNETQRTFYLKTLKRL